MITFLPILTSSNNQINLFYPQTNEITDIVIDDSYTAANNNTVLVLLNSTLNSSLSSFYSKFLRFIQDLGIGLACNASYYVYPNSWNHSQIRSFLNNTLKNFGLRGAILLGQVPAFYYNHTYNMKNSPSGWQNFQFPWDYYYMDLNCIFNDNDSDGVADNMTGRISPEIWVSRIDASGMPNELNLYKDFFDRNHQARNVSSRGQNRGMLWIEDDWHYPVPNPPYPGNYTYQIDQCMANLYNTLGVNRTCIHDPAYTLKANYLSDLKRDYEWLWTCMHSYQDAHQVNETGVSFPNITWKEINNTAKNITFYNLYCCSSGEFTYWNDSIAEWYIFGNTEGQLSIAPARPGGFWYGTHDFFTDLSMGRCIGDSWKRMWYKGYNHLFSDMFPFSDPMSHNFWWWNFTEGTNLFGDPTLSNVKKGTMVGVDPILPAPEIYVGDSVNLSANVIDWPDGWSLNNVSLEFWVMDSLNQWIKVGTVLTDINGKAQITLDTTGLAPGNIYVEVDFNGTANFYAIFGQQNFILHARQGASNPQISPEVLLLAAAMNQPAGNTLIYLGIGAVAGIGIAIILIITVVKKKK